MGGFVLKLKLWWETADRTQRMVAIGGSAFLALMIAITTMFPQCDPTWPSLFGGLADSADQGMVVSELEKDGITAEADAQGNIMVATDKVVEAKIKLATAGKLPSSNQYSDAQFAALGMMTTPQVEKERLKNILEGRISETLTGITGITGAAVHLVLAEDSPFIKDAKPATASISITEKADGSVSPEQGQVIATLVANSVPGLSMNNVAVLNNRMEMLFDGSNMSSAHGRASQKLQAETLEGNRRARDLQSTLDSVFGSGAAIAKVNLTLDFDETSVITDDNVPTKAVAAKTEEKMTGGKPATPILGAPGTGGGADGKEYSRTETQNEMFVKGIHQESHPAGGKVLTEAVSVIFNSAKADPSLTPDPTKPVDPKLALQDPKPELVADMKTKLTSIVGGFLGSPDEGKTLPKDVTLTVTPVKFDTTASKAMEVAAGSAKSSQLMQQIISMLPIAALLLVGFLVMKSIGKFTGGTTMALAGGSSLPVPYSPSALPGSVDGLRVVDRTGGEGGSSSGFGGFADQGDDESDAQLASIKGISRKVNVPLEQIKKMSSDRPETVAMLIKGWLLEER